jgi:hypothetical protein
MFKLDDKFLTDLGLGTLPAVEKNKMLAHIYETLEMRVGMRLAEKMSNEQLDEFEAFINSNNESGALKWLETNFPNYKQVVAEELEKLKSEIKKAAPQIIAQTENTPSNLTQTNQIEFPQSHPQTAQQETSQSQVQTDFSAPSVNQPMTTTSPQYPQAPTPQAPQAPTPQAPHAPQAPQSPPLQYQQPLQTPVPQSSQPILNPTPPIPQAPTPQAPHAPQAPQSPPQSVQPTTNTSQQNRPIEPYNPPK